MSETTFLEEFNSAGNIFNHWVFLTLIMISFSVLIFSVGLSLHLEEMNKERGLLFVISMLTLVFTTVTYSFYTGHQRVNVVNKYTNSLGVQNVTVDRISYGNYVEFSYSDRDGNKVDEKVDSVYVTYVRDLKRGEKVRVNFKKIDIKTLKKDEDPNGLYDVKVHVPNDFKEE